MSEETQNSTESTSSAETENAETTEHRIPKARFDELNRRMQDAETRAAKFEAAEKKRQDDESLAKGEFQKVIDDLKPKAERASELEKTLKGYLDAEIEKIPVAMRDLIPAGDVTMQLAWIQQANAKMLFTRQPAPNTDSGVVGDSKKAVKLTDAERDMARRFNMTDEDYLKFKEQ